MKTVFLIKKFKQSLASVVIREIQIKLLWNFIFTPGRIAKIRNTNMIDADVDVGKGDTNQLLVGVQTGADTMKK